MTIRLLNDAPFKGSHRVYFATKIMKSILGVSLLILLTPPRDGVVGARDVT